MLKGHVFKKQIFGNQIFALFINTFLNGQNGVSNNYKNGMQITTSGSTITVQSGAACIQGRFLEEDTSTQISAGTDTSYCKLVIEINLNTENTDEDFVQGSYKIVKSLSSYPGLTQNDIVRNNEGIYQYELARFKTTASGITDFQDMRTFLDFDSIYSAIQTEYRAVLEQLAQELASVEDGSAYLLKSGGKIKGDLEVDGNLIANIIDNLTFTFADNITAISETENSIKVNKLEKSCIFSFAVNTSSSKEGEFVLANIDTAFAPEKTVFETCSITSNNTTVSAQLSVSNEGKVKINNYGQPASTFRGQIKWYY